MEYRFLGKTGLKVSEFCLGAMTFGRETSEEDSFRILDTFVEAGGNFIDTANVYSHGGSETVVGRWLSRSKKRDDLVIATKVRFGMGPGPNDVGLGRKHILASVQASLKRLGADYLDLYQVHAWDVGTPLEETLSTLDSLVDRGLVRFIGASNFTGWQLQKAVDLSRTNGWEGFVSLQPLYNLIDRQTELDLLPVCLNEGLGLIAWSPLRGGWLSGKYRRGMPQPPAGTRIEVAEKEGWSESWSEYNNEHTWTVLDAVLSVSQRVNKTPAQVALRWLLQRPGVTAPIVGVRTLDQLSSNLGAGGWALSSDDMSILTQASDVPAAYPHRGPADDRRR